MATLTMRLFLEAIKGKNLLTGEELNGDEKGILNIKAGIIMSDFGRATESMSEATLKYLEDQRDQYLWKKKHYSEKVEDINEQLRGMSRLEALLRETTEEYEKMEAYPESAAGKLSDRYYEKEGGNREQVLKLIEDMIAVRDQIGEHRDWLREQSEYWEWEACKLDAQLRENAMTVAMQNGTEKFF